MKLVKKVPFWAWMVLMIAVFLTGAILLPGSDKPEKNLKNEIEYGQVEITGSPLASGSKAIGDDLPQISGQNLIGDNMQIGPTGQPQIIFVVAHWCPHCRKEVPMIVKSLKNEDMAGIKISAVSTAASKNQINYSPGTWLKNENWKIKTMADNELGDAAKALGVEGFPTFILVDKNGKIVEHKSGELSQSSLTELWKQAQGLV